MPKMPTLLLPRPDLMLFFVGKVFFIDLNIKMIQKFREHLTKSVLYGLWLHAVPSLHVVGDRARPFV